MTNENKLHKNGYVLLKNIFNPDIGLESINDDNTVNYFKMKKFIDYNFYL